MTASVRLITIELRRSIAVLAVPVLLALAWFGWFLFGQGTNDPVPFWPEASEKIGLTIIFLGPAAGGLAAWAAGRDRRNGLGDLLQTTPRPQVARHLSLLSATAAWPLLSYMLAAVIFGVITAMEATWGGPIPAPILLGALTVGVHTVIGYAAGTFAVSRIQSRLVAALVPVGLFLSELIPALTRGRDVQLGENARASHYPYENLSPVSLIEKIGGSIYWEPRMEIAWWATLWLGGLGVTALALIALRSQPRSLPGWLLAGGGVAAVIYGAMQLVPSPVLADSGDQIAYELDCTQRSIEVCLHPAYEAVLGETADLVDQIVQPLAGLPGFPGRAAQMPVTDGLPEDVFNMSTVDPDSVAISPPCLSVSRRAAASGIAVAAVRQTSSGPFHLDPAQTTIAVWLLERAGWETGDLIEAAMCLPDGQAVNHMSVNDAVRSAAGRFAALTVEEQQRWLTEHLSALRAGNLALEDLP